MNKIENNDFLTLTRRNEWHLAPFNFDLPNYKVEVWDTGIIYFKPLHEQQVTRNKAIVLSCAIHGNETAPIEICDEMIQAILGGELSPVYPVLFIIGNPASINIGKRFVEENMNRLFSGYHSTGFDPNGNETNRERQRAKKIEEYVSRFYQLHPNSERTLYDLHTAIRDSAHEKFAVYPFLHGKPWKKEQFEILRAMGVTTVLIMQTPATTFSYYASNAHGAESFTIELGKVRPFGENDQTKFAAAKQTLINLLNGSSIDAEQFDPSNYQIMSVYRSINKEHESFELNFDDELANFTTFNKGDVLAVENGQNIVAEEDGEAIVFPNANVALGQRAMLTVLPYEVEHNLE